MVARQPDEIPTQRSEKLWAGIRLGSRRRRAAAWEAEFLDGVVDAQLLSLRRLPMPQREGLVEALAVLVLLAQDHRYYGQGWISHRELRRRVDHTLADLDGLLRIPGSAAVVSHLLD